MNCLIRVFLRNSLINFSNFTPSHQKCHQIYFLANFVANLFHLPKRSLMLFLLPINVFLILNVDRFLLI